MRFILISIGYVVLNFFFQSCEQNGIQSKEIVQKQISRRIKPPVIGTPRILFIGNSDIDFFVSLPLLFHELCDASHKQMSIDTLVESEESLDVFYTYEVSRLNLKVNISSTDGNYYDYVVLQEKTNVIADDFESYQESVAILMKRIRENSPDAIFYLYEVISPFSYEHNQLYFDDWYSIIEGSVAEIASENYNTKIYHVGRAIKQAYRGAEGYNYKSKGKDQLRQGKNVLHVINDGGFLAAAVLYNTIFNAEPNIPDSMTFNIDANGKDLRKLQRVRGAVSNIDTLLKIAKNNK